MEDPSRRLGRAAQALLGTSYSHAKEEVLVGHVLVNGAVVTDPGAVVGPHDAVTHDVALPRRARVPKTPAIEVLFADEELAVVNKPAGLLVHPTIAGEQDTVLSRTAAELERRTGRHRRVLVVHRLDRDTSGVLVLALTHAAAEHLHVQFRMHSVERRYLALARGPLAREELVERNIGRPKPGARRAALAPGRGGRTARTVLRPLERLGPVTLVEAELGTGRTHQVRVHLSFLGHPVLGDAVYGDPATDPFSIGRLALHAAVLAFVHPVTGERLSFRQAPPPEFDALLSQLRRLPRASEAPARPGPRAGATAKAPRRPRRPPRPAGGGAPTPADTRGRPRPARPRRRG
jgi:23S rRNA pseudouridine1911/1915/1917 synthase